MMKKYLYLILSALLAIGCQRSELQQSGVDVSQPTGELVEVSLDLSLEESPATSRAASSTRSWSGGGVEAEITVAPLDESASKAVNERKIANVWILQFDGTASNSRLIYKRYISRYTAGSKVQLLETTSASRVVVVANTFDDAFANAWSVGSSTWNNVIWAGRGISAQKDVIRSSDGTEHVPMSGMVTPVKLVFGSALSIPIIRTVAKVVVNLRTGVYLNATHMDVQMCSVLNYMHWLPDTGTGVWPGGNINTINYELENVEGITSTGFVQRSFWVPVNRRGVVEGTTAFDRVTNAPKAATYLNVEAGGWTYLIHLGEDFQTSYNLTANMVYTYSLTFQVDSEGKDSRVEDRRLGDLVQNPSGIIAAAGAGLKISSPKTEYVFRGTFSPSDGFSASGSSIDGVLPVSVSLNPTNQRRSSLFTAKADNGYKSSLTVTQEAATLTYAHTPALFGATEAVFTITGTPGLTLSLAKTDGDAVFSAPTPATITCDGTAQTIRVTTTANAGAERQARYSATVTNAGASGLDLTDIVVGQDRHSSIVGYVTRGGDGTGVPVGMLYVGMFGGHNGTQYTKALYIDKRGSSASGVNTGSGYDREAAYGVVGTTYGAMDHYNGLNNTGKLTAAGCMAANYCRGKGMYLPALRQLKDGVWLFGGEHSTHNDRYWSSTEYDMDNAWRINIGRGQEIYANVAENKYVRCVMEY